MAKPHLELMFDDRGCTCAVMLQPLGYRCGYVGIPRDSAYWGRTRRDLDSIMCHGWITYAEDHLPQEKSDGLWWIGFDCMHNWDAPDVDAVMAVYGKDAAEKAKKFLGDYLREDRMEVRTLEYCVQECKWIVDQLTGGVEDD